VIIAAPVGRTAIILADDAALVLITRRLQCAAHTQTSLSLSVRAARDEERACGGPGAAGWLRLFRFGWHSSRRKNPS
jgi:hypothetical protein